MARPRPPIRVFGRWLAWLSLAGPMLACPALADDPASWVNARVVLKSASVKLTNDQGVVETMPYAGAFRVVRVDGRRLWLESFLDESGWVLEDEVVRIGDALKFFEEKLTPGPDAYAYAMRASSRLTTLGGDLQQKYRLNIADLTEAIRLDPESCELYFKRAGSLEMSGEPDRAFADTDQAIRLSEGTPYHSRYLFGRASRWKRKGEIDLALADLDRAIALGSSKSLMAAMFRTRAEIWQEKGDFDRSLADCNAGLKIEPGLQSLVFLRGKTFASKADHESAIRDFNRVIELDPGYVACFKARASSRIALGRFAEAIADYDLSLARNPKQPDIWQARSYAQASLGDHRAAIASLDRAIELAPQAAQLYRSRGFSWTRLGEDGKAIEDLGRAVALDPKVADAWHDRASARLRTFQLPGAIEDENEAIRLRPDKPEYWRTRAGAFLLCLDMDRALKDYDEAIGLDPGSADLYRGRAVVFNRRGEYERAIADLRESIRLDRASHGAALQLARILSACPDEKFRRGEEALTLALVHNKSLNWANHTALDVLAGAFAEVGLFPIAVGVEQSARNALPAKDSVLRSLYLAHEDLYRMETPLRLGTSPEVPAPLPK